MSHSQSTRLARYVGVAVAGAIIALAVLVTAPRLAGFTPFTVVSDSMNPTLGVGDVVLDDRVAPLDVRPGDIVTFPDATRGGAMVTHRVERLSHRGDTVAFVTRGDANATAERWSMPADGTVGRVRMSVPKVGLVLRWAGTRDGRLWLVAVAASLLLVLEAGGLGRPGVRSAAAPA